MSGGHADFGCVCASERHWRCGVHGKITPELRAAARYAETAGEQRRAEQERLAGERFACCGELRADGHHESCENWTAPVIPGQESLL